MSIENNDADESALLHEIIADFLDRLSKDTTIPPHTLKAFKDHFNNKSLVTAQDLRNVLATAPVVS